MRLRGSLRHHTSAFGTCVAMVLLMETGCEVEIDFKRAKAQMYSLLWNETSPMALILPPALQRSMNSSGGKTPKYLLSVSSLLLQQYTADITDLTEEGLTCWGGIFLLGESGLWLPRTC